ncbi:metallophosphoesterase [Cognaticolwellia mytili]|uniref:metallophosphoesterase n=1 Tax=Cognaticolwellia mytili TaxID=1888913 RepID=UPI000A1764F3|nr:metallophosphoesterase [Cognaticolwellia mytili]
MLFSIFRWPLITIFFLFSLNGQVSAFEGNKFDYSDGPYVTWENSQLRFDWICKNEHKSRFFSAETLPINFDECGLNVALDRTSFRAKDLVFTTDENIAAISDFHGQLELMSKIFINNGIVDKEKNWSYGKGHLVITGDVFDRGDKVTEILWWLFSLEKQAEQAGGKVHLLLGNHEVMVLNGDLRYIHEKYQYTASEFNQSFEQLYGKNTLLGQWLRSKSVLVKINDMLFAHGGFHPELATEKRTLTEINQVFKANLVKAELDEARSGWGKYLHKRNGPIWYRGYFNVLGASEQEIDLLLKHFDISYLVVGHTSQEKLETRYNGRVIAIDSSIKNGQYGEVLLIEHGKQYRGLPVGNKQPFLVVE